MPRGDLLVWVDLEMTGLDPERCVIVEIATLVTDARLEVIAEGPCLILQAGEQELADMAPEVREMHTRSGLLDAIRASKVTLADATRQTLDFLVAHCEPRTAPLCGNSIWKDRQFIERYMRPVDAHLHYRTIDVSTVKELGKRWYRAEPPKKKEAHRALDDIHESIEELRYWQRRLFVPLP
jgi:oligoribonuclease